MVQLAIRALLAGHLDLLAIRALLVVLLALLAALVEQEQLVARAVLVHLVLLATLV
jgi:hypothetical protein